MREADMSKEEDKSNDLSVPLIFSAYAIDDEVKITDGFSIGEVCDKEVWGQPHESMHTEDAQSPLQPPMQEHLQGDNDKQTDFKGSDAMNGVVETAVNLNGRRKVHWVDNYGKDIAQVKVFESRSWNRFPLDQCYCNIKDKCSALCCHACDSGESDEEDGDLEPPCSCSIQ